MITFDLLLGYCSGSDGDDNPVFLTVEIGDFSTPIYTTLNKTVAFANITFSRVCDL